jgi:hypothetical protein
MKDGVHQIRFDGSVPFPDGRVSRFSVAGSFRLADPTDLGIEVFWHGDEDERRRGAASFLGHKTNHVWLPNERPEDGHVELLGLTTESTTYLKTGPISTRPQFAAMQKGLHPQPGIQPRKFHAEVRLAPSGLFASGIIERHYTGAIEVEQAAWQKPIVFRSRFGELLASETYDYESGEAFGNKVTKQIEKSTITGELVVPPGLSLHEANEQVKGEIDLARRALSFCFRQPIRFYHITYLDLDDTSRPSPFFRRRLPQPVKRLDVDPFIEARNLGNGGLQRIIDAIQSLPQSADLIRAVDFLAESYTSTLENAFFLAFSAMETVINIATGDAAEGTYTSSQWRTIRRALEVTIAKAAGELSLDMADLLEKLPELRRPAFKKRVRVACENFGPTTVDLWPGQDFLEGIAEAAKIRNGLFHAAAYSNGVAIAESLVRVRSFAERLIAKLLKWPDEDLWVWRDQELKMVNMSAPPKSDPKSPMESG